MCDLDNDEQILCVSSKQKNFRLPEWDTRVSGNSYDVVQKRGVGQKFFC